MSDPAPPWLLSNCDRDNHAKLYGDRAAFFDLTVGVRYERYVKVGDECVVATPSDHGEDVNFCWFTLSREEVRADPRSRKDGTVRVLLGKPIEAKSETLTKTDAAAPTSPYSGLFDKNSEFKRGSIFY